MNINSSVLLSSGHSIPILGFGTYLLKDEECYEAVIHALRCGYRHIDSAVSYKNEFAVGRAVRDFCTESGGMVNREDIFITSKISARWQKSPELARRTIQKSLDEFGLDYIDLYLLHDAYSGTEKRLDAYRVLLEFKALGKVRSVGVSNYGVHHLEEIREAGMEAPSVNQIELHPYCQQRPIVAYCEAHGIAIQAYCPLMQGKLSEDSLVREIARLRREKGDERVDEWKVLLRWGVQKGYITLPRSSKPAHIASNAAIFDFELTEKEMNKLDALDRGSEGAVSWNPVGCP